MAKEWILNSATSRYQLNYKKNVGAVSEEIRKCAPKSLAEWQDYYFANVREKIHIEELGGRLYIKITEVISSEIQEITEQDCVDYLLNLVINRTYEGYETEIKTIYGQLEQALGCKIKSAPDEWDRGYNVDFYIEVKGKFIGIQIKPVSDVSHIPQIYKERALQEASHSRFKKKFGGSVFYVFSIKQNGKKIIQNTEVIEHIKSEMERLNYASE